MCCGTSVDQLVFGRKKHDEEKRKCVILGCRSTDGKIATGYGWRRIGGSCSGKMIGT